MSKKQFMPFYVGDYLQDTMHLSTLEHGAYMLLIIHYWEKGGLPQTTAGRARISRLPWATFRDHEPTLAAFFSHPGWRHKRIDEELAKYEKIRKVKAMAGAKGGAKPRIERTSGEAYVRSRKAAYASHLHKISKNSSLIDSERTPRAKKAVGEEASKQEATSLDVSLKLLGDIIKGTTH